MSSKGTRPTTPVPPLHYSPAGSHVPLLLKQPPKSWCVTDADPSLLLLGHREPR